MNSKNYKTWCSTIDFKTCIRCRKMHGKIYLLNEYVYPYPPLHPNCRCKIEYLKALFAGTATNNESNGADWWLKNFGKLPPNYISPHYAAENGWDPKQGNLHDVLPSMMIFGGIYENKNGHLPSALGRIWYEADINYTSGYRKTDRIVFSNDGLIFVTYNHYETFYEIV